MTEKEPTNTERKWQLGAAIATVAATVIALFTYFKPDNQPTIVNNVTLPKVENNSRLEVNTKAAETMETLAVPPVRGDAANAMAPAENKSPLPLQPARNEVKTNNEVMLPGDFPGFNKPWQITLDANSPKRGGVGYYKEFPVRVTQGERLRIQVEPVGGAAMRIRMAVHVGPRDTEFEKPRKTGTLDWAMTKGIPGDSARVRVYSMEVGTLNVVVSKAE